MRKLAFLKKPRERIATDLEGHGRESTIGAMNHGKKVDTVEGGRATKLSISGGKVDLGNKEGGGGRAARTTKSDGIRDKTGKNGCGRRKGEYLNA